MKKEFIQSIKIIIVGLALCAGTAFGAGAWLPPQTNMVMPTGPCSYATNTTFWCNFQKPIDTGYVFQIMTDLGVGPLAVYGDTQIDGDAAVLPATVGGLGSNLHVAGRVGLGVPLASISNALDVVGDVKAGSLVGTGTKDLCADANGILSRCTTGGYHDYPGSYYVPNSDTFIVPDGVYKIHVSVMSGGSSCNDIRDGDLNVVPGQQWPLYVNSGAPGSNFGGYFSRSGNYNINCASDITVTW